MNLALAAVAKNIRSVVYNTSKRGKVMSRRIPRFGSIITNEIYVNMRLHVYS